MSLEASQSTPENLKNHSEQPLIDIYRDSRYVTLYRYENPSSPYDEDREGIVSKKSLIGGWFTNNLSDLRTYIKMRQPGGTIVTIRILKDQLETYDATKNEETQKMDIEEGNFVIPQNVQTSTRIEIPLTVNTKNPKKFLFNDWGQVNHFIDTTLTPEKLIERIGEKT